MNTENNQNGEHIEDNNVSEVEKNDVNSAEEEVFEYEIEDAEIEASGLSGKLKKLRESLKKEQEKSTEYLTGWQTERASFANYKTEEEKKRKERLDMMKTNLVADFFPVLDSFDMAFSNKESWESVDPAWRTGVEYIYTQFMNVLDQYGISKINEINVAFDPMLHDPVDTLETDDEAKNDMVAQLIQSGYKSGELVIRPAKVKVYKIS